AKEDRDRRRRRRHKRRKARDVEHSGSRSDASGTQSSHRGKVQFSDRSRSSSGSVGVNTRRSGDSDHDSSSSSGGPERATINDVTASADLLEMRESPSGGSSAVRRTPPTPDHHNSSAHDLLQLGDPGYTDTQKDTTSVSLVASGLLIGGMDSFNEEPVSFDPLAPSSANSVGTGSVHTIGGKEIPVWLLDASKLRHVPNSPVCTRFPLVFLRDSGGSRELRGVSFHQESINRPILKLRIDSGTAFHV
ncbi:hypothetical protein FOZ62_004240, partial [Perkinsus olseni]